MSGQMNESYFDEKKGAALEDIERATKSISDAAGLVAATRYALPDLVEAARIHDMLQSAAHDLNLARRHFETARWAAARTSLEFEEWVVKYGFPELGKPIR